MAQYILQGSPPGWVRPEVEPWLAHLTVPQRKRQRRLERGLCVRCNTQHLPGRTRCARCAGLLADEQRARREARDAEHRARYGMSEHRLRAMAGWHPLRVARAVIG